jgi:prevent-host-death family protein
MKVVNMREARETFADLVAASQGEPVVLTKHGRPVSVLVGAATPADRSIEEILAAALEGLRSKRRRGRSGLRRIGTLGE